jgi:hypothetical protein
MVASGCQNLATHESWEAFQSPSGGGVARARTGRSQARGNRWSSANAEDRCIYAARAQRKEERGIKEMMLDAKGVGVCGTDVYGTNDMTGGVVCTYSDELLTSYSA